MVNNFSSYVFLISVIVTGCFCKNDYSQNKENSQTKVNRDSIELTCEQIIAKYKDYIDKELNFCTTTLDCIVGGGKCPLGPFFIVNKDRARSLEALNEEVRNKCGPCKYDMPQAPSTLKCKDFKCYPAVNESSTVLMFFKKNCAKLINVYSEDLIGKNIKQLDLNEFLYRVISTEDMEAIESSDPYNMDRAKVIVDKNGIVKLLECDR